MWWRRAPLLFGFCLVLATVACVPPPTAQASPEVVITGVDPVIPGAYQVYGTVKNIGSAPGDFQLALRHKAVPSQIGWANVSKVLPGQTAIWITGILGLPSTVTLSDFEVAESRIQTRPELVAAPLSATIDSIAPPCNPPPGGVCGQMVTGTLVNTGADTYTAVYVELIGTNGYTFNGYASQVAPGQSPWTANMTSDVAASALSIVRVLPCLGVMGCGGP